MSTQRTNEHKQPIGIDVPNWKAPGYPDTRPMTGQWCRLEKLDAARHGEQLYKANALDAHGAGWTYVPYGPFTDQADYMAWLNSVCDGKDPLYFAVVDRVSDEAIGVASYLRITPAAGTIEVGNIRYSPLLQRSRLATETMFLMMKRAFDGGYRRYEWKCDSHNLPSRSAAERLGFTFEGIFRQALVYKGRNRDTAWYAMIDSEWPALKQAFESWLAPENFDADGGQRQRLADLIGQYRA